MTAHRNLDPLKEVEYDGDDDIESEKRVFTRLTPLASWRSEYILRTRLLRSLGRGKPAQALGSIGSPRTSASSSGNAQLTYNSNLLAPVNHLDASFGTGLNKKLPHFIHGADEVGMASSSDPNSGKVDPWGFTGRSFLQFVDRFPGEAEYGLGAGDIVGVPNSMDVSQMYGMVYGEGSPGGMVYYRPIDEQFGRYLLCSQDLSYHDKGIPGLDPKHETICSVWIAKTTNIPDITDGLVGILSGSSYGVLHAYSLGTSGLRGMHESRIEKGELTARWVVSPGVPIVAIAVDDHFSQKRYGQSKIWITVLNALGEVYYLASLPRRPIQVVGNYTREQMMNEFAWITGRSVCWSLVEPTRRSATIDPYERSIVPGSYSPTSSWDGIKLSRDQLVAETREVENFLKKKPKYFRDVCDGWDMRRRLEVDYAGGSENHASEAIFVITCGLEPSQPAQMNRFSRIESQDQSGNYTVLGSSGLALESLSRSTNASSAANHLDCPLRSVSPSPSVPRPDPEYLPDEVAEQWTTSSFVFGGLKAPQLTTTAIDTSSLALLTAPEDPLLNLSSSSAASSPVSSPLKMPTPHSPSEIPGQRGRIIVAGTSMGSILMWNMRAPLSATSELTNTIEPIRIIHTDSPQISCLGLSALYLVHGGNDGLVQAWDPLASNAQPIRTLNSRFSSRARRRLVQAEASPHGVGINLFAAGAICLDPDPTVLRGMVSLGTHLRYWSYSSQAADQYKSNKRRLRRGERGSNHGGEKVTRTGRGALKDYIANERLELAQEKENRRKENARLAGRFGVDLLGPGATEDEMMAYATMLSEEAAEADEVRRSSSSVRSETITEGVLSSPVTRSLPSEKDEDVEDDIVRAIQLSLQDNNQSYYSPPIAGTSADFVVRYVKERRSPSRSPPRPGGSSHRVAEADDLDFALQLSLAEEASRAEAEEDFPVLGKSPSSSVSGKGKARVDRTKGQ